MDLEDSYEGAVRRMQRLEAARLDIFEDQPDRTRELEELATLACEDNERLKAELAAAMSENEQLRANVASLQQALTRAQQAQASAQRAAVWLPQAQAQPQPEPQPAQVLAPPQEAQPAAVWPQQAETDPLDDELLDYPPKASKKPLVIVAGVVALAIGLFVFHPWDSGHAPLPVAALAAPPKVEVTPPPPPPVAPVVTAPVPVVATTVPKVAPTIPKMAPPVAAPARVTRSRAAHKRAKHHAAGKRSGKAKSAAAAFDDPLGGTDL